MSSIRRRLLLSLLTGLLVSTVIMIGVAYFDTTQELQELFTDNLRRMAVVIKGQSFLTPSAQIDPTDIDTGELEESYVIQLWDAKRTLRVSSRPDTPLPLQAQEGLNHIMHGDREWEIYTLKVGQSGYVQIAQPQEIVATMIGESALRALLPLILLFIFLVLGIWYAVGRSLLPLETLSQKIGAWEAEKMEPLSIAKAPQEIQPIVSALNNMLLRLDKSISMQRQFTADAAHELRTPLTAIKIQLDNLIRAPSEHDRHEATHKLSEGIDRCIHLASQLLVASRNVAILEDTKFQKVRLNELVRASMTTFVILATSKKIEMAFEDDTECSVKGDEEGLRVLVNNLMDNAVRYTPEKGSVTVRLLKEADQVILEVSDNGPGIPKIERDKIFQRFYRIPGSASTGSGLGLSIVKAVAENHGATLTVMSGPAQKGTTFRMAFNQHAENAAE